MFVLGRAMNFTKSLAKDSFEVTQELKEAHDLYCLVPERIPVSIDDLHYVVQQFTGLEISIFDVDFESTLLRGMVERFEDNTARISIKRGQSQDLKRFVTAKELCQLAIRTDSHWSSSGVATLDAMVFAGAIGNGKEGSSADLSVQSEYLAEFMAYEILYPDEFRANDLAGLKDGTQTLVRIANYFDVPSFVVSVALSKRYRDFREACLA